MNRSSGARTAILRRSLLLCLGLVVFGASAYIVAKLWYYWEPKGAAALPALEISIVPSRGGRDFSVRTWIHRVDGIQRAKEVQRSNVGLEIDVVFDSTNGYFDVGHPPVPSIGLSLETLIDALDSPPRHYYWLDFKNLLPENKIAAATELERIAKRFGIVDRIIVESGNPSELDIFSDRGFYTSYYLPQDDPYKTTPEKLRLHLARIAEGLKSGKINAVSSDGYLYEFIRKYLPGYDILLWYPTTNIVNYQLRKTKVLADPRVKILLFHESSPGYR